jgi:hypothetical protein
VPSADLFVAVTPYESTNLTACVLATNLGAQKTLARIDNQEYLFPKNKEFFKSVGIDSLIYPEMLAADEIVNGLKKGWVRQYLDFSDGALVVLATKIRNTSPLCKKQLSEAFLDNTKVRIVAIKRGSRTIIPSGKDHIYSGDIVYRTHCQTYGWLDWVPNGQLSGTSGQAKRLEAIEIKLTGDISNYYDVYYRVHCQTYGWLDWVKNGEMAGTMGQSKRLEAIEIKLVPKE